MKRSVIWLLRPKRVPPQELQVAYPPRHFEIATSPTCGVFLRRGISPKSTHHWCRKHALPNAHDQLPTLRFRAKQCHQTPSMFRTGDPLIRQVFSKSRSHLFRHSVRPSSLQASIPTDIFPQLRFRIGPQVDEIQVFVCLSFPHSALDRCRQ